MRALRFIVNEDSISKDPDCDFEGLFNERGKDIIAEFIFSKEWKNMNKVAAFWSILGSEYEPQKILDDNSCIIPPEALDRAAFKIQVIGKNRRTKISTNRLTVLLTGDRR